jgi:hypothetical protein
MLAGQLPQHHLQPRLQEVQNPIPRAVFRRRAVTINMLHLDHEVPWLAFLWSIVQVPGWNPDYLGPKSDVAW